MLRRRKLLLALTLVIGLAIGGVAGYIAQAKLKPKAKATGEEKTTAKGSAPAKSKGKTYAQPTPADPERIRLTMAFLSSNIGPRPEGKAGEKQAASYLATELEKLGYKVGMEQFALPNGNTSQNLVTADPGSTDEFTFFICAHIDSKSGSPGANDNASGCAALLEAARTIKGTKHFPEIRFLLFGAEEDNSSGSGRFGSRYYLGTQPAGERAKILGVISLDTMAVGPEISYRNWGPASPPLAEALVSFTRAKGLNGTRLEGNKSDHEPFGEAGIPAVWLERMLPGTQADSSIHSSSDSMDHIFSNLVAEATDVTREYLLGLTEKTCREMNGWKQTAPAPQPGGSNGTQ
jgi:aminopeptidase S